MYEAALKQIFDHTASAREAFWKLLQLRKRCQQVVDYTIGFCKFRVGTDQKNLEDVREAKCLNSCQSRWSLFQLVQLHSVLHAWLSPCSVQSWTTKVPETILLPSWVIGPMSWQFERDSQQETAVRSGPSECLSNKLFKPKWLGSYVTASMSSRDKKTRLCQDKAVQGYMSTCSVCASNKMSHYAKLWIASTFVRPCSLWKDYWPWGVTPQYWQWSTIF